MTKTKTEAQIAHEARNAELKAKAEERRAARREAGLAAAAANREKLKMEAAENKAARIEAHEQRNAEAVFAAAVRRKDAASANDNIKRAKAA